MVNKVERVIILVFIIIMSVMYFVRYAGNIEIKPRNVVVQPTMKSSVNISGDNGGRLSFWQDDWIVHEGYTYDYNEDITTYLIMGIDKDEEEVQEVYGEIDGGQADALFLLVLNPHDESVRVIGVNRNTMTDVDILDEYGNYVTTTVAQVAVAHGFGDGLQESCKLEEVAVSNIFHSLPIHGYAAINMSAIPRINDAVGGVDVVPTQTFTAGVYNFRENEKVHLDGKMAYAYLRGRDESVAGSANSRLQRQKEYLVAYMHKLKEISGDDPELSSKLYKTIEKQMTTDVTLQQFISMAGRLAKYRMPEDGFYLLKGATNIGDRFEEFYPDKDALDELMLDVFYDRVYVNRYLNN